MLNVFDYLEADLECTEEELSCLIAHYKNWPIEVVFDRSVHVFERIGHHFDRHAGLLQSSLSSKPELESVFEKCTVDRKSIMEEIDLLLSAHVDESGYEEDLLELLKRVRQHIQSSDQVLYDTVRERLSVDEMTRLSKELAPAIFEVSSSRRN